MNDPKKFVAELELPTPLRGSLMDERLSGLEDLAEEKDASFVNNKSLVSFLANVTEQNRQDVLNSTLLAQLAADKKYPNPEQVLDWYERFIEVLTHLGWVIESKDFSKFDSDHALFEMDKAVIAILSAAVGQNYLAVITATLEAMKSLSDDDGRIKMFESNTHQLQKGNMQIGIVDETNNTLSMQIGAFMLETEETIRRIVFFKSNKDGTALSTYTIKTTLNDSVYSIVRNDVLAKLGNRASNYIGSIEI